METTRIEQATKLIRDFNKIKGTSFRFSNEANLSLAIRAIEANPEKFFSLDIQKFIRNHESNDLTVVFRNYIYNTQAETKVEVKEEVAPVEEKVNNYMGLLEKTLAEVIINTQGSKIRDEVISQIAPKVDEYIFNTYGSIKRKVELEVEDNKIEFDEVLHEKFDTVLKFVKMNEPVFLTGSAGTGKNVICKQVAKALGLDFYFSNAVTQEYKITGFTDAMGTYQETQFYKAFKNGGLFMLDEMDASISEVLVILNAAIANRYFDFPAPIGYVEAHPDFRVIAAGNTFGLGADYDYVGRNQLDMASLNRFAMVKIDYDKNIELQVAQNDKELVRFADDFRKASAKAGVRVVVSYRDIGRIKKMSSLMDLKEVLRTCLLKNLTEDDINVIKNKMTVSNQYTEAMC